MADELKSIYDYPDISFIDGYTLEKLNTKMLNWYLDKREELTGERITLSLADDRRLRLQTDAYMIYQAMLMTDDAGKSGLTKYSRGDDLENLSAMKHVARHQPTGANTTIRFTLQQERVAATPIPAGTRVTAGDNVYFATDEYAEILSVSESDKAGRISVRILVQSIRSRENHKAGLSGTGHPPAVPRHLRAG